MSSPSNNHRRSTSKSTTHHHSRSGSRTTLFSAHHPRNNHVLPLHLPNQRYSANCSKLAFFARSRLVIFSLVLCAVIALILASFTSLRLGVQLKYLSSSLFTTLPQRVQLPLVLNPSKGRPIITSSMAPKQYQKPPQAPPVFTATPESLLADTRKLVSQCPTSATKP